MRRRHLFVGLLGIVGLVALLAPNASAAIRAGEFHSLTPSRILDTRSGFGAPAGGVGQGQTITVNVLGVGGVPSADVASVVLNVTVTSPTANGFVTVWPTGNSRPTASNLNFVVGQTVPNLVTVPVGTGGTVSLYNNSGNSQLVADVVGWYGTVSASEGGRFDPLIPTRAYDSREDPTGGFVGGRDYTVGLGTFPAGTAAIQLNVTVTNALSAGYVTIYNDGAPRPTASNLNFGKGETVANAVIVGLASTNRIRVFTNAAYVDIVFDAVASFIPASSRPDLPATTSVSPFRLVDTRSVGGPLGLNEVRSFQVAGVGGIPSSADAVLVNITAANGASAGYFTAWPSDLTKPGVSSVNWAAGRTVPNFAAIPIGLDGTIKVYNGGNTADLILDVVGFAA